MMAAEAMRPGTVLSELLAGFADVDPALTTEVSGLAMDSRKVQSGDLFLACAGHASHGLEFVEQAVMRGASAVAWEPAAGYESVESGSVGNVSLIRVNDLSIHVGEIADRFYGFPTADLDVIGVTGTDGKTQCAHFIAQSLGSSDIPVGIMGTLGNGYCDRLEDASHTTPDAVAIHRFMSRMRSQGVRTVVMEASSHALDQHRVGGVRFDTAVLTNLGRDHLDYHLTVADYQKSKRRLFRTPGLKRAILNVDDPFGRELHAELPESVDRILYGAGNAPAHLAGRAAEHCDWIAVRSVNSIWPGLLIELDSSWGAASIQSQLLGEFNAFNLLPAFGLLASRGHDLGTCVSCMEQVKPVAGRMEWVPGAADQPRVVVDYAHTPQALEAVLSALRKYTDGRLVCVFGAGGERDLGKRPLMGEVAGRLADSVVVTDDNPRSEDPAAIIADILSGLPASGTAVEHDRVRAIERAITSAGPRDVVVIAGKGHERNQEIGGKTIEHDDRAVAARLLGGWVP